METETTDEEKLKFIVEGIYQKVCDSVTVFIQGSNIWHEELEDRLDDVFETAVDSYDRTPKPRNDSLVKKYRDELINTLDVLTTGILYINNKLKRTWIKSRARSVRRHTKKAFSAFFLSLRPVASVHTLSLLLPRLAIIGGPISLGVTTAAGVTFEVCTSIVAEKKRLKEREGQRKKTRDRLINRPISFS